MQRRKAMSTQKGASTVTNKRRQNSALLTFAVLLALTVPCLGKDPKLTADEILSKHLDSIGKQEARAAASSRMSQGKVTFAEIIQHSLQLEGSATALSQGRKHRCEFRFGTPQYPGEQFVFDGDKALVAMVDQTSRSRLGNFLFIQNEILREGLWGGTLSTAWPFLRSNDAGAKVKYEGLKKVNGQQLLELSYVPKRRSQSGDLSIRLYFEPDTYRHVLSVYTLTMLHGGETLSDPNQTTVIVEERFGDFRAVEGLTLPWHWDIRYKVEPQTVAQEYQWDVSFSTIVHNAL
jgi:hypothetical protein